MRTTWADAQLATGMTGQAVRAGITFRTNRRLLKNDPEYKRVSVQVLIGLGAVGLAIAGMALCGYLVDISHSHVEKILGAVLGLSFVPLLVGILVCVIRDSNWTSDTLRITLELERNKEVRL